MLLKNPLKTVIEEIKKRTPIWKKEHYDNEETTWLEGTPVLDK